MAAPTAGNPSGAFERAQGVALRMMETRAFAKGIEEEDTTMVAYIPQLRRLNELGMITFDSQSGKRQTLPHYQTGKTVVYRERAYCNGFVDASVAEAVITWMWDNTDKYVARAIDVEEVSRGDKGLYSVLSEFGRLGVSQKTYEGVVSWPTQASPVVMQHDYACNYGRFVYPEQRGNPPDADGEEAIRRVGPYKEHPVPRSAVCLLCIDMRLERRADAHDGLFTQLEAALRAVTRPAGNGSREGPESNGAPKSPKRQKSRKGRKGQKGQKSRMSKRGRDGRFTTRPAPRRQKARGGSRSPCAGARRGRCASARRSRRASPRGRARSRGARRS